MKQPKNPAIFLKNPYTIVESYYLLLCIPSSIVTALMSKLFLASGAYMFWEGFLSRWGDIYWYLVTFILSFLAALALLVLKAKRARKKQKSGFNYSLRSVAQRSLGALGFGLIWLSLLPLPFLSQCIDLFTRKSFVHFSYWKPFGLHHILIDAPQNTNVYDINGFTCRDHLMTSGWPIFWAFNISLILGALTVWVILKIRANRNTKSA